MIVSFRLYTQVRPSSAQHPPYQRRPGALSPADGDAAASAAPESAAPAPAVSVVQQDKEVQQDDATGKGPLVRRTNEEMLASGGCSVAQVIYENGEEWHPVLPTGEQKCVKCRCKVRCLNIKIRLSFPFYCCI